MIFGREYYLIVFHLNSDIEVLSGSYLSDWRIFHLYCDFEILNFLIFGSQFDRRAEASVDIFGFESGLLPGAFETRVVMRLVAYGRVRFTVQDNIGVGDILIYFRSIEEVRIRRILILLLLIIKNHRLLLVTRKLALCSPHIRKRPLCHRFFRALSNPRLIINNLCPKLL